ncbi:NADPH-dependent F420 reductase [Leucobacter triazinivorans]|uniref:Diguanylate cyclase n=1 Tax=Leucobacter triazinivorans TaxID=1784719 RepID=A0A4P6KFC3_9MICO|nr:NADPH-dependent F420 reductase [Leucobacter triazinivorans]QBE48134.1 diguanylate cyclase [Leucobacter triazinivorans]
MTAYTIFGTGNMAQAIGGVLAKGGASVEHISHEQGVGATVTGDVVVLAVPYPAVAEILGAYGDQLAGRIVVDITNPLDFETFDGLVVPDGSSAAAEIQRALPDARVLKAFNTNFAATLASGTVGDSATTVLVAGDAAEAKSTLMADVVSGGLRAIDAGSLARAHELEAIGFLQLTLAVGETISWTGGFAVEA